MITTPVSVENIDSFLCHVIDYLSPTMHKIEMSDPALSESLHHAYYQLLNKKDGRTILDIVFNDPLVSREPENEKGLFLAEFHSDYFGV